MIFNIILFLLLLIILLRYIKEYTIEFISGLFIIYLFFIKIYDNLIFENTSVKIVLLYVLILYLAYNLLIYIIIWIQNKIFHFFSKLSNRGYILVLRSFNNVFNIESGPGLILDGHLSSFTYTRNKTILPKLFNILNTIYTPVVIGKIKYPNFSDNAFVFKVKSTNKNWYFNFLKLAKNAKAIFYIPSESPSLNKELEVLKRNKMFFSKLFIFIPPIMHTEFLFETLSNERLVINEYTKEKFNKIIPQNIKFGCIYFPKEEYLINIEKENLFTLYHWRATRNLLKEKIKIINTKEISLSSVLKILKK